MQAFCALADSQPAQQSGAPTQHVKHTRHSVEPAAQPATAPVSCQSIVQAMARSACPAAAHRQGAALKRKASLVRPPTGAPLQCRRAAIPARKDLRHASNALRHQWHADSRWPSNIVSLYTIRCLYTLQCTRDGADDRELRELIKTRFKGLLESAKAKHSAPVQAELADARQALAAMEAEREHLCGPSAGKPV